MCEVESREDCLAPALREIRTAKARREVKQAEIVVAGGVSRRGAAKMFAPRAETACTCFQVMNRRCRLEPDRCTGIEQPPREIGLESIGGAGEILVEAADGDRSRAIDGEISRHHIRD